jgi:hypothetical protein
MGTGMVSLGREAHQDHSIATPRSVKMEYSIHEKGVWYETFFDLYALGILLLEIGIWKPFPRIIGDALASKGQTLQDDSHVSPRMRRELLGEGGAGAKSGNMLSRCIL